MSIAQNKKAFFDYFIEEKYEAGIVLEGWEVKAIREGKVNIKADDGHTYRCLKLAYLESEDGKPYKKIVDFFVSDDANHIPVLAQAKVLVGSIKMELSGYEGLANPIAKL